MEINCAIAMTTPPSDWRKISRQFFNQRVAKSIAPCIRDSSRAFSELHAIARNSDWFIALFALVVIGRSNYFGIGFSIVI